MGSGTNLEISMIKGSLSFGIRPAQSDGVIEVYKSPSVVFALDSSFNAKNPSIEHLRTTFARNGNLLPVVRFLISNSSEHIERCLPILSELQRLRLLAHYIYRLHDAVGDLQDDALNVHEDAEELLSYLLSDNFNASWSWPKIEPLQILSPAEIASALGPEAVDPSTQYMLRANPVQKRLLVSVMGFFPSLLDDCNSNT
jgi:Class II histone deacetylase complex subunits 2 and 3.